MPEGAIYVGRPSLWGNPWTLPDVGETYDLPPSERAAAAVRLYRKELEHFGLMSDYAYQAPGKTIEAADRRWEAVNAAIVASGATNMAEYASVALRGHDLVCWCPLVDEHGTIVPCHADVLLELANRDEGDRLLTPDREDV